MSRLMARTLSIFLLVVLGVCIGGPALDPTFELPAQHFDGDADDSGHVGEIFTFWVDTAVTGAPTLEPPAVPIRQLEPTEVFKPPRIVREPLGSRGPPA